MEKALECFGEKLIVGVRDETIANWNMILNGKMNGITAKKVKEMISNFSNEQLDVLKLLIPKIVDTSLHNLLFMISQNNEIKVEVYDGETNINIKEVSDGLEGELYTEDGWIMRFSKEDYDEI